MRESEPEVKEVIWQAVDRPLPISERIQPNVVIGGAFLLERITQIID